MRPRRSRASRARTTTRRAASISSARRSYSPVRQIAQNAGHDGAVVSGKLLEGKDEAIGFNAQTEVYENLVKAGVIDPTKVVRTALQDAASVAGLLITTEAAVERAAGGQAGDGRWAAAEWAEWAEWTSRSDCSSPTYWKGRRSDLPALLHFAPCR